MIAELPVNGTPPPVEVPESELLRTVSASRLNTFLGCRLKFFFRYVQQLETPVTAALFVGQVVHTALQGWNKARWKGERPSTEQVKAWFDAAWTTHRHTVPWEQDEAEQRQTGWSVVSAYLQQTPIPADEKPQAVEVALERDLAEHGLPKLVGVLDLVRAGGTIVDFKTSSKTPDPDQQGHTTEVQFTTYSLLYEEATGHPEAGREIHTLVKTKVPKVLVSALPPITGAQRDRLFHQLDSYVAGVRRQDYVPSPGMACSFCEFFGHCRRWTGGAS